MTRHDMIMHLLSGYKNNIVTRVLHSNESHSKEIFPVQ